MLYIAERSTQPGHLDVIVKMSCAMPTSRAGGFIDELAVLEAAGDARQLEGVRQLIMRGMKLTGFKPACVSRLQSLTVLSLSNNSIRDLKDFHHLISLIELNLNFNAIASLEGLACPGLQKLFLSNNLIAGVNDLSSFPKLRTLCLFSNILPDLTLALQRLRDLEQLQELDLDGNPCASSRGYKHRIVRACPGLLQLDGEDMSQLDRDLSELFFEETEETRHRLHGHRTLGQHLVGGGRPATAPMRTKGAVGKGRKRRSRCGGQPRDGVTKGEESALLGEQISFPRGQPELLAGGARFFSSDRLNDDPYLLSYLAEDVLVDRCLSPRDVVTAAASRIEKCGRHGSRVVDDGKSRASERGELTMRSRESTMDEDGTTITVSSSSLATTKSQNYPQGYHGDNEEGAENDTLRMYCEAGEWRLSPAQPLAIFGKSKVTDISTDLEAPRNAVEQEQVIAQVPAPRTEYTVLSSDVSQARRDSGNSLAVGSTSCGSVPPSLRSTNDNIGREDVRTEGDRSPFVRVGKEHAPPLPPPPPVEKSKLEFDPSDPYTTIRKLLKVIEMLQLERADCHTHQTICKQSLGQYGSQGSRCTRRSTKKPKNATHTRGDGSVRHQGNWVTPAFVSGEVIEVRQLRLENRNMHLLLAENRELKRDARGVREKENEIQELRTEVSRLREQLGEAGEELELGRARLREAKISKSCFGGDDSISSPTTSFGGNIPATSVSSWRPGSAGLLVTAADVLVDCEDVDEELADLFRRNEQTMGQIRRDLTLAWRQELKQKSNNEKGSDFAATASATAQDHIGNSNSSSNNNGDDDEGDAVVAPSTGTTTRAASETAMEEIEGTKTRYLQKKNPPMKATHQECTEETMAAAAAGATAAAAPSSEPPSVSELLHFYSKTGSSSDTTSGNTEKLPIISSCKRNHNSGSSNQGNDRCCVISGDSDGDKEGSGAGVLASSCFESLDDKKVFSDLRTASMNATGLSSDSGGSFRRREGRRADFGVKNALRERGIDADGDGRVTFLASNARALLLSSEDS